jgi:hypothetical protein
MLRNYAAEIQSVYEGYKDKNDDISDLINGALVNYTKKFIDYLDETQKFYSDALKIISEGKSNKFSPEKVTEYSLTEIENKIRSIWNVVNNELTYIDNKIRSDYKGFINVVDLYTVRFNRI